MPEDITNAVLNEKLDGLKELMEVKFQSSAQAHDAIYKKLDAVTEENRLNTEFRIKGSVSMGLGVFIAASIFSIIATTVIAKVF